MDTTWKARTGGAIDPGLAREIDIFETEAETWVKLGLRDSEHIAGIVTEFGVIEKPDTEAVRKHFRDNGLLADE